jgi:hypothetical protein
MKYNIYGNVTMKMLFYLFLISLGPRHRWEDNTRIKLDLTEIGWEGVE